MRLKHPDMRPTGSPVALPLRRPRDRGAGRRDHRRRARRVGHRRRAPGPLGRAARAVLRHGRVLRLPGDGRRPAEPARLPDQGCRPAWTCVRRPRPRPAAAEPAPAGRGDRLRRAGGRCRAGRPVGGARAGAGRRRRGRARRAAPPGRPVLQAAGALAPGRDLDPRQPVPRRCGADAVDAAGRRAPRQRGDGVGGLLAPRGRRPRRRPARRSTGPSGWFWRPVPTSSRRRSPAGPCPA